MKIRIRLLSDEKLVPFQLLSCDNGPGDNHQSPSDGLLAIPPSAVATATGSYSRFKVPDDGGWIVEEVPRRDGSRIDKYYYEAGTGTKFRSSKEVERYIKGGDYPSISRAKVSRSYLQHCRYSKCIMRGGKVIRLDEEGFNQNHPSIVKSNIANGRISITDLPDGWVIEEVPRRLGGSDRYYYEPGTGRRFRSLVAVFRYLDEEIPLPACIEEMKENAPLSKAFKLRHKGKDGCRKRNRTSSNGNGQTSSFVSRPEKVRWVLCSIEGDEWYPVICGIAVPDSVKQQQWYQRYMEKMTANI